MHMNKTKSELRTMPPAPPTKRYDEAFKRQAVANWMQSGKAGTQIARELGLILIRFQDETNCGRVSAWQDHAGLIHRS